jgi:DNA-directed RNA polymerase subunit M/transcription elongation factor TFIIS
MNLCVAVPTQDFETACSLLGVKRSREIVLEVLEYCHKKRPQYHSCIAWDIEEFRDLFFHLLYNIKCLMRVHTKLTPVQVLDLALARPEAPSKQVVQEQEALLESIIECADCRRKGIYCRNVYVDQKQTRSGDEGMTAFAQCRTCRKRWKFAG